jgi:hypothetical protein
MKVTFADSFWKSLKRLSMQQTWWYKTYEVFRYKIPMFFENLWYFRKELWRFRSWDYSFNLMMLSRSLEKTVHTLEFHGWEIEETKNKKVEKIKRVIEIIKSLEESNYINRSEKQIGELRGVEFWEDKEDTPEDKEHNKKVFDLATKIEEDEWEELFNILKGQNHKEYIKLMETQSEEDKWKTDLWIKWFDGSGMKHWWD